MKKRDIESVAENTILRERHDEDLLDETHPKKITAFVGDSKASVFSTISQGQVDFNNGKVTFVDKKTQKVISL